MKRCSFGMYWFLTHGRFVSLRNFFLVSNKAMKTGYIEIDHMVRLFFFGQHDSGFGDMTSGEKTLGRLDRLPKNASQKSRQTKFWQRADAICNLYSCYNFALMLQLCTRVTRKMHSFRLIRLEQFFFM